jgi:hypothetical protein
MVKFARPVIAERSVATCSRGGMVKIVRPVIAERGNLFSSSEGASPGRARPSSVSAAVGLIIDHISRRVGIDVEINSTFYGVEFSKASVNY